MNATVDETGFHLLHRGKTFLPQKPQERLCISSSILSSRYKSLFLTLKQSQYKSNHSATSSADVQNLARKSAQGRDSSVGIATRYCRRVKDRITVGGEINRTRSYRTCGPSSPLYNGYWVSFSGVKQPVRGLDYTCSI